MNQKHHFFAVLLLVGFILSGCGSSAQPIPTQTGAAWTATPTAVQTTMPTTTPTPLPTTTLISTPVLGATQVSAVDGMELVFVPAGEFSMGSLSGMLDEQPQHAVYLDGYWIDRTEVTNAMYDLCVQAGACLQPYNTSSNTHFYYYFNTDYVNFPVIALKWSSAEAYCAWAGRRLPTEAEWEKAARGSDGRTYPWGDGYPNDNLLNFNHPAGDTSGVGSYLLGASPYGVLDMAGNANEWVADWYSATYYRDSPSSNPDGPDEGQFRVLRGGSWHSDEDTVHSANRSWLEPDTRDITIGFRCAVTSP